MASLFHKTIIMKKLILLSCAISFSVVTGAQTSKWFVTFSTGLQIAGPSSSLRKYMKKNGFNVTSQNFLFGGTTDYPRTVQAPPLLGMFGRQISSNRGVYFILGMPGNAEVRGYNGLYQNNIKYHIYQLGAGYQLSSSNSRSKLGGGPSLFILRSGKNNHLQADNALTEKHSAVKPGLSITGSTSLGKQRKPVVIELFAALNIAAKSSYVDLQSYDGKTSYNMNMIEGMLGLSLAIRKY